jgi:hypothetical protein
MSEKTTNEKLYVLMGNEYDPNTFCAECSHRPEQHLQEDWSCKQWKQVVEEEMT